MLDKILTPVTLWEDFYIYDYAVSLVRERSFDGFIVKEYFLTRKIDSGEEVKIYFKTASLGEAQGKNVIYYLQDATVPVDEKRLIELAEMGYLAVSADICSFSQEEVFVDEVTSFVPKTVYPEKLFYATAEGFAENPLYIGVNAKVTAYYQWTVNAKYLLDFLRKEGFDKFCVMADGHLVNTAFHLGATEDLCSIVTLYGSGWLTPLGHKYGGEVKIDFNETELKFIAGIEAQSYAGYVNCPTLMCVATNSKRCDIDRAYDTFARIREDVYSAMVYTVGLGTFLNYKTYCNVSIFIAKYFGKNYGDLQGEVFTDVKIVDGKLKVNSKFEKGAVKVSVYASEGVVNPIYRCWKKIDESISLGDTTFETEYSPAQDNKIAFFFTEVTYGNGFTTTSAVVNKRFSPNEVKPVPQFKTVYSSLEKYKDGIFEALSTRVKTILGMKTVYEPVALKQGARSVMGVDASRGLLTLNVLNPANDAMMVLSVCAKENFKVTVELLVNAFTDEQKSYFATFNLKGGNLWHELNIELAKFKTAEGYSLKTYEKVGAIKIYADKDFCINNLLWV